MDFAVVLGRKNDLSGRFGRWCPVVEDGHLRVVDRVGVVVTLDAAHKGLAVVEIEALDLKQAAFDDVNRLFVEHRRPAGVIGFADHPLTVGEVNDDEVVRADRPQADRIGGIRLVGPLPLVARELHKVLLAQNLQHLLDVERAKRLGGGEGQFKRSTLHVGEQDVQVVRVDERVFRRRVKKVVGITRDKLIDRRTRRHQHRRRSPRPSPRAARSLPCGGDGSRVAGHNRHVEGTDVDAELQRAGGHHAPYVPIPQTTFNLTPSQWEISPAVSTNDLRSAGRSGKRVLHVRRQNFGGQPALREHDDLQATLQKFDGDTACLGQIRPSNAELRVDDRRVHKDEVFFAPRRTRLIDQFKRRTDQFLRQLAGIGDRG